MCIVIRYFGGVKLGTGGLIRAYSKACKNALKIINLKKGFEVKIVFNYDELKKIDYLLKNCEIITKSFKEIITYTFKATEDEYNIINSNLKDKTLSIKHIYF